METIKTLSAREILDSRGIPTIEVAMGLASGATACASVPSGASTGSHEAHELRDNDPARYDGKGVLTAIKQIETVIASALIGKTFHQQSLDATLCALDGTTDKSRLGANALLAVSLAFARAAARAQKVELYEYIGTLSGIHAFTLPQPFFNILNGGKHADNGLDIQEFMIAPKVFGTFAQKVQVAAEIMYHLHAFLKEKGYGTGVGDEGGFAPKLPSNEAALDVLIAAVGKAGYTTQSVCLAIDAAASSFFSDGHYVLHEAGEVHTYDREALVGWYQRLVDTYPIVSLEDPFAEDDWEGFAKLRESLAATVSIVGDDLTVTNVARIEEAIKYHAVSAVLIKPNQIGTLSETIAAIQKTRSAGWVPFLSHRSGETIDSFIADLAVGAGCSCIKAGSLTRGERVAKYNRLMEIEAKLQKRDM